MIRLQCIPLIAAAQMDCKAADLLLQINGHDARAVHDKPFLPECDAMRLIPGHRAFNMVDCNRQVSMRAQKRLFYQLGG